jgi:hypothetical protein
MLWVLALSHTVALRDAVFDASRRYHRSLALIGLYVTSLLSITVLSGAASYFVRLAPCLSDSDRAQDLASIFVLLPGLVFALFFYLLHDAAMASLAAFDLRPFEAVRTGFRSINRRGCVLAFFGWHCCSILLTLFGIIVASYAQGNRNQYATAVLVLSQMLVIGRITIRGRWLASLFGN